MKSNFLCNALVLDSITPSNAPANSLFRDSTNGGALSFKPGSGPSVPLEGSSSQVNLLIKSMKSGIAIAVGIPVAKNKANGRIYPADSDDTALSQIIGFTMSSAANPNEDISVVLIGPNIIGAIEGKGFNIGDTIYMSQDSGMLTNDFNSFTGDDDNIFKVGIADNSAGTDELIARDLITQVQYITSTF